MGQAFPGSVFDSVLYSALELWSTNDGSRRWVWLWADSEGEFLRVMQQLRCAH